MLYFNNKHQMSLLIQKLFGNLSSSFARSHWVQNSHNPFLPFFHTNLRSWAFWIRQCVFFYLNIIALFLTIHVFFLFLSLRTNANSSSKFSSKTGWTLWIFGSNGRKGPKKVPQRSHLSVGRGLIAIWAMEGDFYNGASLRWHWMILDDIWWYWKVNNDLNIGIFKFENLDFQTWISRFSNLNIPLSQWWIWASGYSKLKIGIFKFENRDIQIWKSGFSNLKIGIFKFEYKNDAV